MEPVTRIPNRVIAGLVGKHVSGTDVQVVLALAYLTWGEGRDEIQVTLAQLADSLNSGRTTVSNAVGRLLAAKVIRRRLVPGDPAGSVYSIEADTSVWQLRAKEPEIRAKVLRRDNYTCSYCGSDDRRTLSVDHVIPKSKGGGDDMTNLTAACAPCNVRKGTMGPERFFRENPPARAWVRALAERLTPPPEPEGEPPEERLPRLKIPDMEARELPSANEVRAIAGPFICPIFEEECPLKTEPQEDTPSNQRLAAGGRCEDEN